MYNIKIVYRIEQKIENEIDKELEGFISKSISENKNINSKKLVSMSIRVSVKQDNKQTYLTLITNNNDIVNYNSREILSEIKNKLSKRNINIENVTFLHIHLFLV